MLSARTRLGSRCGGPVAPTAAAADEDEEGEAEDVVDVDAVVADAEGYGTGTAAHSPAVTSTVLVIPATTAGFSFGDDASVGPQSG